MSKLRQHSAQWRALQPWERRVLIHTALLLPLAWLGLRVLGFKRMRRFAECSIPANPTFPVSRRSYPNGQTASNAKASLNQAQRTAQLVAIAARHGLYQANCLHQSLPLCRLLRRQQGLPAMLKIGVHNQTLSFQAHAWVELDGVPLGQVVAEYVVFSALNTDSNPLS